MSSPVAPSLSPLQRWLIVIIASIGFLFDTYQLLMLPLILRPALQELLHADAGSPEFNHWKGLLFFVPALFGGLFGLLGGYLTDLFGRRRVLVGSILLYAVSAYASAFSTSMEMLLVLRILTFIGVCVEFVAAVAWLAELFPDHKQREKVLGYSQAFSSFGGIMIAIVNGWLIEHAVSLPAITMPTFLGGILGHIGEAHADWRYTLISGLLPAIPLIVIRPFLPESPAWKQKKDAGTLKRPSIAAIFAPELRKTTIVTCLMAACSFGAAFGAIQQLQDIVPGLKNDVNATREHMQEIENKKASEAGKKPRTVPVPQAGRTLYNEFNKLQEVGGLAGRFVFAILATILISQRRLLRCFQLPGLIFTPLLFYYFLSVENRTFFYIPLEAIYLGRLPISTMSLGVMLAGFFTVAQFSFWGNYLPRVYPLHLRGTGESFAMNIGGRMIGTSFAFVATTIADVMIRRKMFDGYPPMNYAISAAAVALFVYLSGSILCFFLTEPKADMMAE
ncbi:MAG TPA: MFS transporter [Gemmataceae bacterium]|nr:MFS transporter [Gemmataceae bacterium]